MQTDTGKTNAQQAANKPRVFVSSTIRDFRDLRSSLKFWLEEFGFEVRMSEFNDFVRPPDEGTFDSCFSAIADCHYYILLIGGRKGSDYLEGTSVTQQEYRVAADLAQRGRITPVVFVRAEAMAALGERRALKRAGIDQGVLDEAQSEILEDPAFIKAFIGEIRATELSRRGEDPSGTMWTYPFNTFRDLADALRVNLRLHGSVTRQNHLANIRWELVENVRVLCSKHDGLPTCGHKWISQLRHTIKLSTADFTRVIEIPADQVHDLDAYVIIGLPDEQRIRSDALEDGIASGEFLLYHQASGGMVSSSELELMRVLLSRLQRYKAMRTGLRTWQAGLIDELERAKYERRRAQLAGHVLGLLFAIHDIIQDVLRLSASLLSFIATPADGVVIPILNPPTPFEDMVEGIHAETPSHDEIEDWLGDPVIRSAITGDHILTIENVLRAFEKYPQLRSIEELPDEVIQRWRKIIEEYKRRVATEGQSTAEEWLGEQLEQMFPEGSSQEDFD